MHIRAGIVGALSDRVVNSISHCYLQGYLALQTKFKPTDRCHEFWMHDTHE